jgi:hypothetical protein
MTREASEARHTARPARSLRRPRPHPLARSVKAAQDRPASGGYGGAGALRGCHFARSRAAAGCTQRMAPRRWARSCPGVSRRPAACDAGLAWPQGAHLCFRSRHRSSQDFAIRPFEVTAVQTMPHPGLRPCQRAVHVHWVHHEPDVWMIDSACHGTTIKPKKVKGPAASATDIGPPRGRSHPWRTGYRIEARNPRSGTGIPVPPAWRRRVYCSRPRARSATSGRADDLVRPTRPGDASTKHRLMTMLP